ncbi:MAG: cell envelope integrity protein TolA [Alphaproteobacteria bacterium]|nr:cell envelope integrity protein TolA [Alphaproteobacteria bacterium]
MVDRNPASIEMRMPAIVSAMLHVAVLGAAVANFDFFHRPPLLEPEPVMIEFEAIDKKAAAPKVGNPPPQPKDAPVAEETTKAPPPKTADPPPAPEKPKPEVAEAKPPAPPPPVEKPKPEVAKPQEDLIALKPKEPEPPKVEKPPEPPKPVPEVKKAEPPKPPPPKPAPPKPTVDSRFEDVLKNLQSPQKQQTPEQQPKPTPQVTRQAPAAPNLAAVVTASEIEGVRSKIRPCWNTVGGARDQNLVVTLVVQMNQDGTPVKAELKDTGRYNNDPVYRAAADAAYRAIMNPRCQPWPLSPEKYNSWRNITFNFDPRDY